MPAIIFELWDMLWNVHYWPKIVWWLDVIGSLAYVTQLMVDFYKGHRVTGSLASQSKAVFGRSQIVIPAADQSVALPRLTTPGSLMNMSVYNGQCSVWLNCELFDVRSEVTCSAPEIPWHALEDEGISLISLGGYLMPNMIEAMLSHSQATTIQSVKAVYVIPRDQNHSVSEWCHVYLECSIARLLLFSLESRV